MLNVPSCAILRIVDLYDKVLLHGDKATPTPFFVHRRDEIRPFG